MIFDMFQFIGIFILTLVSGKRFLQRRSAVPPSFVFIGSALLTLNLSLILKLFYLLNGTLSQFQNSANKLYFEASVLFLIYGVGCRVIPMIKGFNSRAVKPSQYRINFLLSLVILTTYFLEYQENIFWVSSLRNLIYTGLSLFYFKTFLPSERKSRLNQGLCIAELMLLLGLWLPLFIPQYFVHLRHLIYIGGFGLITLLVSTRVIFAHGSAGIENEKTSPYYFPILAMAILAIILRLLYGIKPDFYPHVTLAIAACLWILICLTWLYGFFSKIGNPIKV
jgi:uncharacterized protein involved in response to NO